MLGKINALINVSLPYKKKETFVAFLKQNFHSSKRKTTYQICRTVFYSIITYWSLTNYMGWTASIWMYEYPPVLLKIWSIGLLTLVICLLWWMLEPHFLVSPGARMCSWITLLMFWIPNFSFSKTGRLTKDREPTPLCYFTHSWRWDAYLFASNCRDIYN